MTQLETQDTEITLGTGRLLGLFFGLVIVCALFFGLGFSMGKNSQKSTLTMVDTPTVTMQAQAGAGPKTAGGAPARADKPADCSTPDCQPEQQQSADSTPASTTVATTNSPELAKGSSLTQGNGSFTVQIAAVSKQEDADALVSALKKKSYPVFIAPNANDKLFHVQIGPFAELKDAESMKAKLTGDGYNPIVKK